MTTIKVKQKSDNAKDSQKAVPGNVAPTSEQPFNLADYAKGVKQEWFKISWPTREQVFAETGVVLVVVAIFSIFVLAVDKIFQFIITLIT